MGEVGGDFDLAQEPLRTDCRREFWPQNFHRHLTVVFQVLGELDRGHPARTQLFLNGVAVG